MHRPNCRLARQGGVTEGRCNMDIFSLGGVILDLLQTVVDFWNDKVSLVFELLGQSPVSFKDGGPWGVIADLEPIFVAVGSSLVVLFFVIGFC